jgi:NAD(P)-dependent dehydrogenase (short-subunit alcohol dehydrogenase family)
MAQHESITSNGGVRHEWEEPCRQESPGHRRRARDRRGHRAGAGAAGAAIMIADILEEAGSASAPRIAKDGSTPASSSSTSPTTRNGKRAVAATVATLGGYDILINNAGIEITSLVSESRPRTRGGCATSTSSAPCSA